MQEAKYDKNNLSKLINELLELIKLRNADIKEPIYMQIFEVIQSIIDEAKNREDIDKEKLEFFHNVFKDVFERYKEIYPTDINSQLDKANEEFEKNKIGGIFPFEKYEHRTNPEIPFLFMGPTVKELRKN